MALLVHKPTQFLHYLDIVWNWLAHTVQWGNAQELITWMVAGVALWFARKAAIAAKATNDQQERQIRALEYEQLQRARAEERAQAELIAVWGEVLDPDAPIYRISNNSGQPVYGFLVWHLPPEKGRVRHAGVLPPGDYWLPAVRQDRNLEALDALFGMPLQCSFWDKSATRWLRHPSGSLEKLDADPEVGIPDSTEPLRRIVS